MNLSERINTSNVFRRRNAIKLFIGLMFIIMISVILVSLYVGLKLTVPKRDVLRDTPKNYGLIYEDISFKSKKDNVVLNGWWIPAQSDKILKVSDKTVIFSHGYGDNRALYDISVMNLAKRLNLEGYNVLAFDFRAEGESQGKFVSVGEFEKYDLLAAIDFAKNNKSSKKINLIGWSMGATTSLLAAADSNDVQAVVADSPFAKLKDYLSENLPYWSGLPDKPFTNVILSFLPIMRGVNLENVDATKAVSKFENKPLLLIHSKDDKAIPYSNTERIYEASDKKFTQKWITEKADHIRSYLIEKENYEDRIVNFFKSVH